MKQDNFNTERYRSGHNGADSKSVVQQCTVGSNPTRSAIFILQSNMKYKQVKKRYKPALYRAFFLPLIKFRHTTSPIIKTFIAIPFTLISF